MLTLLHDGGNLLLNDPVPYLFALCHPFLSFLSCSLLSRFLLQLFDRSRSSPFLTPALPLSPPLIHPAHRS